jgi:hypothetical protein
MTTSRNPFYSPQARLNRANQHIARLHKGIERFVNQRPYKEITELQADGVTEVYKFKITKTLPESCVHAAAEALEALRSVLDQSGYAAAVASGKITPKRTQFPIGDDPTGLENVIGRKVAKDLPDEILTLFRSFKPYQGGNNLIWALNKLANAKHTTLLPVTAEIDAMLNINIWIHGDVELVRPVFDRAKREIVFARVRPGGQLKYDLTFAFFVALGEIDFIARHQAVAVLRAMSGEVARILKATEATCRNLGFLK